MTWPGASASNVVTLVTRLDTRGASTAGETATRGGQLRRRR